MRIRDLHVTVIVVMALVAIICTFAVGAPPLPASTKVWTFSVQTIQGSGNNLANGLRQQMYNPNAGIGGVWTDGSLWRTKPKPVYPGNWELKYDGTTATLSWVNYAVNPQGQVTGKYTLADKNLYDGNPKVFVKTYGWPADVPNRGPNWPSTMKLVLQ